MQLQTLTTTKKHTDPISRVMAFNSGRIKEIVPALKSFSYQEKRIVRWTTTAAPSMTDFNTNQQISLFVNKWGNNLVNKTVELDVDAIVYAMANPRNYTETIVWYQDSNRIEMTQVLIPMTLGNFVIAVNANNQAVKCKTITMLLQDGINPVAHNLGTELIGLQMLVGGQWAAIDWNNANTNTVNVDLAGGGSITATLNLYYI